MQVSDDVILQIEHGKYPHCRLELAQSLDRILETGGTFERAWPMAFRKPDADKKAIDAEEQCQRAVGEGFQGGGGRILGRAVSSVSNGSPEPVDRRAFLSASTMAALAPLDLARLVAPTTPYELPSTITPGHVDQIVAVATNLHSWDNRFGGGGLIGEMGSRALECAVGLLSVACPSTLRDELLAAVARLGMVVGATHFDMYAHDDARVAFKVAADCAEEAGNWHLRAKTYSFLARQAVWIGDPDDGLTQAEKGLVRSDRITATEQAMLHTARARAFAKMRNVQAALSAVGAADEAFARSRPEEDPPWMAYYDAAQHAGDTAHALFDLALVGQDPAEAGKRFQSAVRGHGDAFARSRAISCTKLASLIMFKGDPNEAAAIGHRALDESGRLTSRRAADDLRELARYAGKHPTIGDAAALKERIVAALPA